MRDEMRAHLEQATERFVARGMTEADARDAARREFGNVSTMQQSGREARGGQWVESALADLKYALRYFARTPLATATIVLTLALGIGFSSAVFSVLTGILTRPAPGVPDDRRLVKIRGLSDMRPYARLLSYPELQAYAALTSTFESVTAWVTTPVVVDEGIRDLGVTTTTAQFVTPNYFKTLGVRLAAGRTFSQSRFDERFPAELTAIASYGLVVDRFGGVQAALGKRVKVNGVDVTIVGVAPPRFAGPVQRGEPHMIWLPLSAWQTVEHVDDRLSNNMFAGAFDAAARLGPGVSATQATAAVRVIAARFDAERKARVSQKATSSADVVKLRGIMDVTGRYDEELMPGAIAFIVIALLVLLVCTTTVNSLLIGAAVGRRYEIGVRLTLGAPRSRIIRQLLTEVLILAFIGGALGMWTLGTLAQLVEVARDGFDVSPDWRTTGFMLVYSVVTATLAGLSPALHATRIGLSEMLKDGSAGATRRSRLQATFVVAQIAIAQPLMVILAASLASVLGSVPDVADVAHRERLLLADFNTSVSDYLKAPNKVPNVIRRVAALPGVIEVLPVGYGEGLGVAEPGSSSQSVGSDSAQPHLLASTYDIAPGYLQAVGSPIIHGRDFVASDTALGIRPVIVSQRLADSVFGATDPVGQRMHYRPWRSKAGPDERPVVMEVVGVVRMNSENNAPGYPSDYAPMFVPFRGTGGRFLIRTSTPAKPLIARVMEIARAEAPLMPVEFLKTLAQSDRKRRDDRVEISMFVAGCGALVLLLASVGLYAMVALAVGQRSREIGVRVALGARTREIVRMFFKRGLRAALLGVAIGLPIGVAGLVALRRVAGMLWVQVPIVIALLTLVVIGVASLASWLPARRAATVDPMTALRAD